CSVTLDLEAPVLAMRPMVKPDRCLVFEHPLHGRPDVVPAVLNHQSSVGCKVTRPPTLCADAASVWGRHPRAGPSAEIFLPVRGYAITDDANNGVGLRM